MNADRGKLIEDVFLQVSQAEAGGRAALLERLCNGDVELKREVESLLKHHEASSDFLDSSDALAMASLLPTGFGAVGRAETALPPGKKIGSYTIVSQIGVGGMGVVYVAEQERPRRTVALKLMRRSMASRSVLKRFEHEAEVLGRLQHPGIAQIFEAGTADWGYGEQPFFAMEFVKGSSLTSYAAKHNLGTRDRLALIAEVCDAVQHAHQRGVIHRDLKPGNILVSEAPAAGHDSSVGAGKVKVLDFGVARLTGSDLMVTTLQTGVGQLIGTLPYMSPEQVTGDSDQVDTRADVYALGVILYELLAGRLPHDVRSRSLPEAARVIRDEPPARLSSVSKVFRGDVDTIVAKALEKDRGRRYQSAADLAADIRRYLAGEAIEAKRDSAMYVLRKQLKRYRGLVALAAVLVLLLAAFAVYAAVQSGERGRLLEREREASNDALIARDAAKAALKSTEEARDAAIKSQRESEEQKARADAESLKLRENLYFSRIGFAQAALADNDAELARRLLDLCPEDQRAWEWNYLRARSDEASFAVDARPYGGGTIFLSQDGTRIVSLYQSGRMNVLDAVTGREILEPKLDGVVAWASISPRQDRALAVFFEGNVAVWDFATGGVLRAGDPVPEHVSISKFSPDGSYIASQRRDFKAVTIWDPTTFAVKASLPVNTVSTLTFSPDGRWLAVGTGQGALSVWSTADWTPVKTIKVHTAIIRDIAFSPDGSLLATGSNDMTVRVWETAGWTAIDTIRAHSNKVGAVAFSPDGRYLASAGTDSVIKITDAKTRDPVQALRGHSDTVTSMAFAPDGRLFSTSRDGTVRRWDNVGEPDEPTLRDRQALAGLFLPDGARIAIGGTRLEVVDVATMKPVLTLKGHKGTISGLAARAEGPLLASACHDRTVRLWNTESGALVREFSGYKGRTLEAAFVPGTDLLATVGDAGVVKIWNVASGEPHAEWICDKDAATSVAASPDGKSIAVGLFPGPVEIRTLEGTLLRTLNGPTAYAWALAYSKDGGWLFVGSEDGSIYKLDAVSDRPPMILRGHKGAVHVVSVSPDGRRLISGGYDNTARLWDTESGQEIISLRGHTGAVHGAAFSPDGSRVLTAGNEGLVKIWDSNTPR